MSRVSGGKRYATRIKAISAGLQKGATLKVGFFNESTYPDGTPVTLVAAANEFGRPENNQPPRPFMRNTIRDRRQEWGGLIKGAMRFTGGDAEKALELVGVKIASQIQDSIRELTTPELAPATIDRRQAKRKRGKVNEATVGKPLIDTGVMLSSVTHKVEVES